MLVIITKINISTVYYSIFNFLESNFLKVFLALLQRFRISECKSKRERSIAW